MGCTGTGFCLARAASHKPPEWRPFQLAFVLMNLRSFVTPTHADRELVDLLFFPTGGGKTEAYLGLAAFVILLRRLRHRGLPGRVTVRALGHLILPRGQLNEHPSYDVEERYFRSVARPARSCGSAGLS